MNAPTPRGDLGDVGLLADQMRRRLYDFVSAQPHPVTREAAADATGISRTLAAYHLDKLAHAGLLTVSRARVNGRTGPGAGRPAKHYARSPRELTVTLPPRNYSLLAQILATAADADSSERFRAALTAAAETEGRALGQAGSDIPSALSAAGYEPEVTADDDLILRNCPFHSVMADHRGLVCTLNRAFIGGALEGSGDDPARAELAPGDGRCCVIVHPEPVGRGQADPAGRDRGVTGEEEC
ncbi:helix-turn-helix transcriptional regulator [Microbacterium sp. 22242]|uniref:helix-turn-helix transcriptional regulator n=1 Tax=Microbacterium sp. 22242 TaxID=3453896 RepID=UPI003F877F46